MQKRALGKSGLDVSALGFGCMGISFALREIDQAGSQMEIHGARYPEHLQKTVGR